MGCTIGAVFEAASIVGVRLFDADETAMAENRASIDRVLMLMPKAVRSPPKAVKDDF